jgi:hypothetical protein
MNQKPETMNLFFNQKPETRNQEPVECLDMTFESDEKRREYFLEKLREKLKDPEFHKIEGFPVGSDEDILALSDPPYYTACPNPWIADFIAQWEAQKPEQPESYLYHREPFAADVSEGKNDPIYNTHSYHTKVPHKAIMRYILHYTQPGDIVFDGFCGTGMTGVAAQMCGDAPSLKSLGYHLDIKGNIMDADGRSISFIGDRLSILNDLSIAATFISHKTNNTNDIYKDIQEIKTLLLSLKEQEEQFRSTHHCGWPAALSDYDKHRNSSNRSMSGVINYVIWSDVVSCPNCGESWIYWDSPAVDQATKKPRSIFNCNQCNIEIRKGKFVINRIGYFDPVMHKPIQIQKKVPILINYSVGKTRYEKFPDEDDITSINQLDRDLSERISFSCSLPDGFNTRQPIGSHGWSETHHFFSSRAHYFLSKLLQYTYQNKTLLFVLSAALQKLTLRNRFMPWYGGRALVGPHPGTLYVPNLSVENDVISQIEYHLSKIEKLSKVDRLSVVSTQSAGQIPQIPDNSIDYIFIDPPFGANIMYSELNTFWECILRVSTNSAVEAIENPGQNKDAIHYGNQIRACFLEFYRIVKPGRWMTIEFHNSRNYIWNIISESLTFAGFIIADVRILDKSKGTIHQLSNASSVDKDLIISAYKPNCGLAERFKLEAGTEDGIWDFIRTHLEHLPVFVSKNGQAEVIAERQNYLLFDRMVAFHVQRGVTVPLSAAEFYAGLEQRFPPRDDMYFLPDQVAYYDKKRMTVKEVLQLQLFVSDEASAIQWLRQQLTKKPQTFQDIHPQFLKEIGGWQKHEKALELSELLKENFLLYDGKAVVPSQIHSYLSSNFKELRNLEKDDPALKAKAKDRWYVPDPNKAGDLEKLRERALIREFEEYHQSKQKRLKVFRLEAVRAGFKKAWQERDYATIIAVARKIPEKILQEDPKLLMWYDQAVTRMGVDT